ncbi:MAG: hypothetical protein QF561_04565 [Phycisphaerales bacterium]|jgi:hypothetical protein|nr:hypothetical protein [Phycisphaerales bacterium]
MNQAETLRAAMRQPDDEVTLRAAAEAVSRSLAWCATWAVRGDAIAAAALNADAGNIIGLCLTLHESGQPLPSGLRLPATPSLEALARIPATGQLHRDEVDQWTLANLEDRPLPARLAAARALRLLEPNNPLWKRVHEPLEQAAVALWSTEVERCLGSGDERAIAEMSRQAQRMEFLTASGQHLLHQLDDAMADLARQAAGSRLDAIERALHLAWAAMDAGAAAELVQQWRTQAEASGGGSDIAIRGVLSWLEADQDRRDRVDAKANLVIDLVRSLDELEPVHGIERRYAAAIEAGAAIPRTVETRVAHRIAEERRARARRFTVGALAIVAVASALAVIIFVRHQSLERARTITYLSDCMAAALQTDRLPEALDCWAEAERAHLTEVAEIASHRAAIGRASETLAVRRTAAEDALLRATSMLEREADSLASVQSAIALLRRVQPDLPPPLHAASDAALEQATAHRTALLQQERTARLEELASIELLFKEPNPLPGDLAGWTARLAEAREAARLLAAIRLRPAADEITTQQRLESLEHRVTTLRSLATTRVDRLLEGQRALKVLSHVPTTESMWARAWDTLISEYPDVINAGDRAKWGLAAEAASAARAVEDWRSRLSGIAEAQLWSTDGPPQLPLVGGAKTSLQSHLDAHGMHSPYRSAAERLVRIASAMQDARHLDPLEAALEDSGLLDLYRAETPTGYHYLKRAGHSWRRLESRQDLRVPASHLEPLTHEAQRVMFAGVEPSPPPAVAALHRGLEAWRGSRSPEAAAALLQAVEQCNEQDPLLVLAILRTVWSTLRSPAVPLPEGIAEAGAHWLDTLSAPAPSATTADWVKLAPKAAAPTQHEVRRQALHAPHAAPSSDEIRQAWRREVAELSEAVKPRIIGGLLRPDSENPHVAAMDMPDGADQPAEVLLRAPLGWRFHRIDTSDASGSMPWPGNMPHAPAIIFVAP